MNKFRARAAARTPPERSVVDDLLMKRPWNLAVKAARAWGRLRRGSLDDGVTVVIVNWNTRDVTTDVIRAVQQLSPAGTRVLVVDNGSTDGSRAAFRAIPGIARLHMPVNIGHGPALDMAIALCRTRVAVALDSDAIPLNAGWLDPAVSALSPPVVLAGTRSSRGFAHPMYLALDVPTFLTRRLSFQVHRLPGVPPNEVVWGTNAWDTGELMTAQLSPDQVHLIPLTPNTVDGLPGVTCGDVVYHHGGVSRASDGEVLPDALASWRDAYNRLLPDEVRTDAGNV